MADAQANININLDASQALAQLRALQAEISTFQQKMLKLNASTAASAANVQRNLLNTINATGKFSAGMTTVASSTETFTNSLEKNKFSMGEYFRYAGGASKTFGKLFTNEFNTIEKVARERVKTLQTQYIKLGREANGAMKAISVRPLALDMDNLATKTMIAAQKQQILNQLLRQGSTNLLNWGKNTQWAGRQLMVGFTIPLTIFGSLAAKTFMELEEQAIRFKRVYGELFTTQEETDKMLDQLRALGSEFTKYGVALKDTMAMAADAAAMGKTGVDLLAQVSQASRLAVLGGVEQQQALETTISLTNAFGVATEDLTKKIDFLNAVENQTVVSIEDLTIAIPKAGPVVKQLGGNVEDLAFFLTAMKEGGINASEGANALKSGLASLINPSAKSSEFLANLGININSIVEGNAGDIKGTVIQFAQALDTLDPLNRARAIEQLFGKFQFSRLSTLFQNVVAEGTQASRVLGLTAASTQELAILSERELKRIESSPLFKFRKSFEDLQVAMAPVGEEFLKAVTPIIEFGTKLLEKFDSMSDGGKQFVTILVAGLGVVAPTLLMIIGLVGNGVANMAKFMLFLKGMGKGGAEIQQLGMQTEYMTQQQLEANAAASALSQTHSRLQQAFTSETAAVKALAAAYREAAIASKALMTVPAGRGGAARAAKPTPKATGLAKGILSVPGPKGAGDVVPAMLSPGEAVIPAKQANKYAGFISSIMQDKVPGYRFGFNPFAMMLGRARVAARMPQPALMSMISQGPGARYSNAFETQAGADYLHPGGRANPKQQALRGRMEEDVFGIGQSAGAGARPTYGYARISPIQAILNRIFGLKGKQFNAVTFGKRIGDIGSRGLVQTRDGKWVQDPSFRQDMLSQYGDVDIVTNRSVSRRSSAMAGDALIDYRNSQQYGQRSPYFAPAPMQGATQGQTAKAMFDSRIGKPFGPYRPDPINNPNMYGNNIQPGYIETHTPGGFGVNEISRIIAKDRTTKKAIQEALKASGLKIRVTDQNFATKLFQALGIPGFEDGIFSVPGPKGAGDVVPAMLSPGEAVIPAKQSKKYSEFIQSIIADRVPGYAKSNIKTGASPISLFKAGMAKDVLEKRLPAVSRTIDKLVAALGPEKVQKAMRNLSGTITSNADLLKTDQYKALQAERLALKPLQQLHMDAGRKISAGALAGKMGNFAGGKLIDNIAAVNPNALVDIKGGWTRSGSGVVNRGLTASNAPKGFSATGALADYQKGGVGKYSEGIRFGGGNLSSTEIKTAFTKYDQKMVALQQAAIKRGVKFFADTNADIDQFIDKAVARDDIKNTKAARAELRKQYASYEDFDRKAAEVLTGRAAEVRNNAINTAKVARYKATEADIKKAQELANNPKTPKAQKEQAKSFLQTYGNRAGVGRERSFGSGGRAVPTNVSGDAQARKAGENIGNKVQENVVQGVKESTKQTSPSKAAKKSGANIGTGAIQGIESAVDDAKAAGTKLGQAAASGVAQSGGSQSKRGSVASRTETKVNKSGQTYYVLDGKQISEDKAKTAFANQERARRGAETRAANRAAAAAAKAPVPAGAQQAGARGGMGMGGVGMLAMTAGMMAPMLPGKAGEVGGQLAGPLMALGMLSMLPPQIAIVVAALGALGFGIYKLLDGFNKAVKSGADMVNSLMATEKSLMEFSEAAGTVTAGEIMDRKRQEAFSRFQVVPGKSSFGENYVQSESGQALLGGLRQAVESGKFSNIEQMLTNKMATAVASGALSAGQARSVVAQLAEELNNQSLGIKVNGSLINLLGPNGENLLQDPLEIRLKIVQSTQEQMKILQEGLPSAAAGAAGQTAGIGAASTGIAAGSGLLAGKAAESIANKAIAAGSIQAAGLEKMLPKLIGKIALSRGAMAAASWVGGPVAGVVGSIAAIALTAWDVTDAYKNMASQAGAVNAINVLALEQQQEMLDSLDLEYGKRIANAQAAGDMAAVNDLILQQELDKAELLEAGQKTMELALAPYQAADNFWADWLPDFLSPTISSMDKAVEDAIAAKYEGDAQMQAIAKESIRAIDASALSDTQEYQMKLSISSGDLDPQTVLGLISQFGEDAETLTKIIDLIPKFGGAEANRAIQIMNMFVDKDGNPVPQQQQKFLADISVKNPKQADTYLDMFQAIMQTAEVIDPSITMEYFLNNPEIGEKIVSDIEKLKQEAGEGPITITMVQNVLGTQEFAVVKANQKYFDNLDPYQQIIYLTTLRTQYETLGTPEGKQAFGAAKAENPGLTEEEYLGGVGSAAWKVSEASKFVAPPVEDETDTPSGRGAEPQIDSLLKKLRDLRLATIDMKKGWEGMQEVLESVFAGGTKGIDVFEGLSNQIRKMGVGENLIEMIIGMDPDEYTERKNELFVFDKAGNIVETTAKLKNMQSAFNAIAIGEYVNEQQRFIENAINQSRAISILTANGMSLSEAYQLVQDEALAAAIAMGATKAEIQEIIKITGLAQQQRQNMEKEQETSRISESVRKTNEEFKNQVNILNQLSKARGQYSDAQIQAILGDPDLQKLFLNPSIDPRALQEALNNANKQANLELSIKKLTVGGQEEIFQTGLSAAMSAFSAKEQEIDIQFRATIADDESLVKSAKDQLAKIDFELDDYQAALQEISWAEQKINDSYKDRFDALSKVSELNDQITASKARQLDLADALSRGDIAAAAKAAQEMRSQEQTNAIETQRTMMETAQQTEIARLRSSGGLSRDQIDEKILQLEKERFGIEENTIEPAQERIRLEEIQRDLRVADLEVLGKTRDEWEAIGNRIDVAQANGYKFADAMKEALNIVETLVGSLLNRPIEVEAPLPSGGGGGENNRGSSAPAPTPPPPPPRSGTDYSDKSGYKPPVVADRVPSTYKPPVVADRVPSTYKPPVVADRLDQPSRPAMPQGGRQYAPPIPGISIPRANPTKNRTLTDPTKQSMGGLISKYAMGGKVKGYPMGGLIPYKAEGGFFKSLGSDTVPAMLTPGEFVVRRPAVKGFGKDNLEKINRGTYEGNSVYNYNLEVNVKSGSNPNEIANTVMRSIKQVEGRRIRGNNL